MNAPLSEAPVPSGLKNIPGPFQGLMKQVEARLDNLRPDEQGKALGIIRYIRQNDRASVAQAEAIKRFAEQSKTKWKSTYKPRPLPFHAETPTDRYFRKLEEIHARDYGDDWRQKLDDMWKVRAELEEAHAPELSARQEAERKGRREYRDKGTERYLERSAFRFDMVTYDRVAALPFALPGIIQPHLLKRDKLLKYLRRRREWLLADNCSMMLIDRKVALRKVRMCLGGELLAHFRELQTIRNLQAAE